MIKFQRLDIVQLLSGGPLMTVTGVEDPAAGFPCGKISTIHFEQMGPSQYTWAGDLLQLIRRGEIQEQEQS